MILRVSFTCLRCVILWNYLLRYSWLGEVQWYLTSVDYAPDGCFRSDLQHWIRGFRNKLLLFNVNKLTSFFRLFVCHLSVLFSFHSNAIAETGLWQYWCFILVLLFHFAAMGNERSNSYWEAELPPNYDRVGIENFIRAKYEDSHFISCVSLSCLESSCNNWLML